MPVLAETSSGEIEEEVSARAPSSKERWNGRDHSAVVD